VLSHLISLSVNVIQFVQLYHFLRRKVFFKRHVGSSHMPILKFMDTEVNSRYQQNNVL